MRFILQQGEGKLTLPNESVFGLSVRLKRGDTLLQLKCFVGALECALKQGLELSK